MMNASRELKPRERQSVRKLIREQCANYDSQYGCLLLDCSCPVFGACYANSAASLCRYFREAVLPANKELQSSLEDQLMRVCRFCGKKFPADGKRVYCCEKCAQSARRMQNAARVRKFRNRRK